MYAGSQASEAKKGSQKKEWPRLVAAMARIECGTTLPEETIKKGYKLYKNEQA